MIEIEYLRDLKGAQKFGTCGSCGKSSNEDPAMARLRFTMEGQTDSSTIFLCDKCRKLLYKLCDAEQIKELPDCTSTAERMADILADVLDDCPLTDPCDKMWKPEGWCKENCGDGQSAPNKKCWLKYAEVMANE